MTWAFNATLVSVSKSSGSVGSVGSTDSSVTVTVALAVLVSSSKDRARTVKVVPTGSSAATVRRPLSLRLVPS